MFQACKLASPTKLFEFLLLVGDPTLNGHRTHEIMLPIHITLNLGVEPLTVAWTLANCLTKIFKERDMNLITWWRRLNEPCQI